MTNNDNKPESAPALRGSELIIPVAAIALAIYYFSTIIDSPWTAKVTAYIVGLTLVVLSVLFIAKFVIYWRAGRANLAMSDLIEPAGLLPQRLALFALTLASVVFIPLLGFTLTSILFLSSAMLLMTNGSNVRLIVPLAIILSIVWFILFVLIFKRKFPLAWLDNQITAIVLPLLQSIGLG